MCRIALCSVYCLLICLVSARVTQKCGMFCRKIVCTTSREMAWTGSRVAYWPRWCVRERIDCFLWASTSYSVMVYSCFLVCTTICGEEERLDKSTRLFILSGWVLWETLGKRKLWGSHADPSTALHSLTPGWQKSLGFFACWALLQGCTGVYCSYHAFFRNVFWSYHKGEPAHCQHPENWGGGGGRLRVPVSYQTGLDVPGWAL